MANYNIVMNRCALDDLDGINRYISKKLLMPMTAAKTVKHIEDQIRDNLSFMPYYSLVGDDNLAAMGIRRMIVKKYIVFFIIFEETNTVSVERIIHGARDWKPILSAET